MTMSMGDIVSRMMVGLDDLGILFQPLWFYASLQLIVVLKVQQDKNVIAISGITKKSF